MPIDTSRDDLLGREAREERRAQIEQYVLSQPWRRRPRLAIPLRMDNISPLLKLALLNVYMVPREHRRVSSRQWRDISEEWESRDPTTEVPIAKRIVDMVGDTAESFLDSYPIPDNLHRAGRVNHILRSPIRPPYPEIGEEEVISNHVIDLSLIHISEPTRPY